MTTLGDRIRQARNLRHMTQAQLATACGWDASSRVGNYEQGTREPSIGDLLAIAGTLDVSIEWLVTGSGQPSPGVRVGTGSRTAPAADDTDGLVRADTLRTITVWEKPEDLPSDAYVTLPRLELRLSGGNGGPDPAAAELLPLGQAFRADFVRRMGWKSTTHFSMRCVGHSMEPTIPDGAPVVVNTAEKTIRSGKIYAILVDGEPLLKRLDVLPGGNIRVRSDNQSSREFDAFEVTATSLQVIGRAVWTSVVFD